MTATTEETKHDDDVYRLLTISFGPPRSRQTAQASTMSYTHNPFCTYNILHPHSHFRFLDCTSRPVGHTPDRTFFRFQHGLKPPLTALPSAVAMQLFSSSPLTVSSRIFYIHARFDATRWGAWYSRLSPHQRGSGLGSGSFRRFQFCKGRGAGVG